MTPFSRDSREIKGVGDTAIELTSKLRHWRMSERATDSSPLLSRPSCVSRNRRQQKTATHMITSCFLLKETSRYDVRKIIGFFLPPPLPCPHLDMIYTINFTQPPFRDIPPPMWTSYLEAPQVVRAAHARSPQDLDTHPECKKNAFPSPCRRIPHQLVNLLCPVAGLEILLSSYVSIYAKCPSSSSVGV